MKGAFSHYERCPNKGTEVDSFDCPVCDVISDEIAIAIRRHDELKPYRDYPQWVKTTWGDGGWPQDWTDVVTSRCVGLESDGSRCFRVRDRHKARPSSWREQPGGYAVYLCEYCIYQALPIFDSARDCIRNRAKAAETRIKTMEMFARVADTTENHVYFIGDGRYVKIGTSKYYKQRAKTLISEIRSGKIGTARPDDVDPNRVRLIAAIPGDRRTESTLHIRLDKFRVNGEWFTDGPKFRRQLSLVGIELI